MIARHKTAGRTATCLLLSGALLLQGCWGPFFDPEDLNLPQVQVNQPIQGVVVGTFIEGFHTIHTKSWVSGDYRYTQTIKRINTGNVNFEIADKLRGLGIPARAVRGTDPRALKPGEVMLRGMVQSNPDGMGHAPEIIQFFICCFSLFTYGTLIPFVFPWREGTSIRWRLDMSDLQGNVVLGKRGDAWSYYKSLYIYGPPGQRTAFEDFKTHLVKQIAERVRPHLARRQ